jgi:hypothetical protein
MTSTNPYESEKGGEVGEDPTSCLRLKDFLAWQPPQLSDYQNPTKTAENTYFSMANNSASLEKIFLTFEVQKEIILNNYFVLQNN